MEPLDKEEDMLQAKRRPRMKRPAVDEACTHEVVLKDLCAHCGKRLHLDERQPDDSDNVGKGGQNKTPRVSMLHHVPELKVSSEKAQEIGETDRAQLLKARKLVLLVDLDQTLIHTTNRPPRPDENVPDVVGYRLGAGHYYTKLRPHVKEFLAQMHDIYEMHVVSFGERLYAHKIAELLDPENKLFNHRVLSRNELLSAVHKTPNLKALFPCGEEMLVIIDDRADVWLCPDLAQCNPRLIRVKPYRYFAGVDDVNAVGALAARLSPTAPLEESRADELREQDAVLKHLGSVLTRVHARFYGLYDAEKSIHDTKEVILGLAAGVLRGEHVVLSGLVPLGQRPAESPLYRTCVQYGAEVEEQVGDSTTVVVAARWGTEKTRMAKKRQIPVVSPRWLEQCCQRWERVDPSDYLLAEPAEQPSTSGGVKPALLADGSVGGGGAQPPRASVDFDSLCADTTILDEGTLRQMDDEVDDALSSSSSSDQKNGASDSDSDGGENVGEEDSGEYDDVVADIESQFVGKLSESEDKT